MRRRAFLRAGAGVVAAGAPTVVAADADQSDGYGPAGEVPLDGTEEVAVGDDRETAYVATTTGFATVDVSDPETPTAEPTPTETETPEETATSTPTEAESSPGFGPLVAGGGLSLGAWRFLRRRDQE